MKNFASKISCVFIAITLCCGNGRLWGQVEAPKIISTQLHEGSITIAWELLSNPDIVEYRIQYGKSTGNPFPSWVDIVLPTTIGPTQSSYTFSASLLFDVDVYNEPVAFAIKAFTATESSKSDLQDWDSTIFLQASFDSCLAEIELNWTPYDYNRWEHGLEAYKVMVSTDGGAYQSLASLTPSDTNYVIEDLTANVNYQVYISAVADTSTQDETTSFAVDILSDMQVLPGYIYADFGSYSEGNAQVQFSVDPLSEITNFKLLRASFEEGPYDSITNIASNESTIAYLDEVEYEAGPYFYKLEAINNCGENIFTSDNIASTIVLQANGEALSPNLTWNGYKEWTNGVAYYALERDLGTGTYEEITQTTDTAYEDASLEELKGEGSSSQVCYRVKAYEQDNPYGNNVVSLSNTLCVELPVNMRFEYNAFIPGDANGNDGFEPTMDFVPDEFDFSILDRSGHVLFESKDPDNARWDGKYKGKTVTQGAYMYVLKYRVGNAKPKVLRGGLSVVLP